MDEQSRDREYPEINPAGRFAVHLFGHMHQSAHCAVSVGGGPIVRTWQGHSLFGLEHFGENIKEERCHGYSAGQIEFGEECGLIRHWPRVARRHGPNGWIIIPDYESGLLEDNQGTRPEPVEARLPVEDDVEALPHPTPEPEAFKASVTTTAGKHGDSEASEIQREHLEFLRKELAITPDPVQKFNLRKLIDEAERELGQ
ncbi:MAG: hypothetical protein NTW96_24440 [Planctomycetia bacterium]|nr:hypothetical protein [Planctomycetia bacterium]